MGRIGKKDWAGLEKRIGKRIGKGLGKQTISELCFFYFPSPQTKRLSIRVVALCFGYVIDLRKRHNKVHHHDHHRTVLTSEMRCVRYEDDNSVFLTVVYVMFETALVDYVVPDPCQETTHSHDATLMRFCAFT